ncbi:hypothetical protein [Sphingobium yanoikuyae]|uniref:Uncharacterized protein n=1 Tax=Sphingobium yanoikuyae TaxID=13690 RepID=A0A9X7U4G0_SPHYA|nr:hypothetical protein [Sphingobium yanoikuyae]QNG43558.1 hypothetical protein H3V42_16460 [Sphingobium yanoikuyae]
MDSIARSGVNQDQWRRVLAGTIIIRFDRLDTFQGADAFDPEDLLVILGREKLLHFAIAEIDDANGRKAADRSSRPSDIVKTQTPADVFDFHEASIGDFMVHQHERAIYGKNGGIERRSIPVDCGIIMRDGLDEQRISGTENCSADHDVRGYAVSHG